MAIACLLLARTAAAQGTRATVTGTVLGPTGAPQGNVTLVITNAAGVDRRAVTEPTGGFVFGGLAPGTYRLRVDDETVAPWSQDQIVLAAGERRVIPIALQLRVQPQTTRGTIAGTVFGPDGRTRGDVTVIVTNAAGIDRRAVSEPTGAYVFGGLAAGTYRIRVEEQDALPLAIDALPLAAGERRLVDLRLQPKPAPPPPPQAREAPGAVKPEAGQIRVEGKTKPEKPRKPKASDVPEVTATDGSFEAKPDRWHFAWPKYERYSPPEKMPWVVSSGPLDPYNQNAMKGDFPIGGGHTFLNLNLQFNSALNPREAAAGGPQQQIFYNNNLVGGVEVFGGDTVFQPKKWAVRATAVANYNGTALGSFSIGDANKRSKYSLEEAFVEKRLTVLSPAFDFVSVRGGMQNFTSDFRGYVFQDNQLGVRLFGNARSNRDQYNVAYFAMRDRDAFSQLHDILGNRNQDVIIANYFVQDFGAPGYTAMFNVHVNRDRAGDRSGAAPLNATYLGFHGDGRLGSWSVSHAFYQVFGSDGDSRIRRELNSPFPPPAPPGASEEERKRAAIQADLARPAAPVDISAQMAALELSRDADWKRYRFSVFYASGDDGADPAKAKGFDNITDNPNLAGGQFMFWTQQATKTLASHVGEGLLSEKFSLLPNMRSKFVARSNFVNPGIIVLNGGVDFRVSPQIKVVTNASYLRFATAELLRSARVRGPGGVGFEDDQIGLDYSVGAKIRPFTNENLFLVVGFAVLQPRGGFATALTVPSPTGVSRLYSFFTAFQVAF